MSLATACQMFALWFLAVILVPIASDDHCHDVGRLPESCSFTSNTCIRSIRHGSPNNSECQLINETLWRVCHSECVDRMPCTCRAVPVGRNERQLKVCCLYNSEEHDGPTGRRYTYRPTPVTVSVAASTGVKTTLGIVTSPTVTEKEETTSQQTPTVAVTTSSGVFGSTSLTVTEKEGTTPENTSDITGIAVGVSLGGLFLLALILALIIILYRRKRNSAVDKQSRAADLSLVETAALPGSSSINQCDANHTAEYEEIGDPGVTSPQTASDAAVNDYEQIAASPPSVYASLNSQLPSSSSAAAAAASASVPAMNAAVDESSTYNDTSTTLVDNALYDDVQQPAVTSSNDAEADDDVTDLTLIDNDLYEREGQGQGQQNPGSVDYECTLVDNDLYQ